MGGAPVGALYPGSAGLGSDAQALSDTLATISDTLTSDRRRQLTDTVAWMWDTLYPPQGVVDTLVSMSDVLVPNTVRPLADTLVTLTDIARKSLRWDIVDTLATISETLTSNNRYAQRIVLFGTAGSVGGTTVGATSEPGEFLWSSVVNTGFTLWYEWTAPATGKFRFAVRPDLATYPLANPWVQVYRYDPGAVIPQEGFVVVLNDEASWTDVSQENDAVVNLYAEAGETFVIQVGAWTGGQSWFMLEWFEITLSPDYDDFPGRTLANLDSVNGNLEWCTDEPGDPRSWIKDFFYFGDITSIGNRTAIFKVTPEITGTMSVSFVETDTSDVIDVFVFDGDGAVSAADLTEDKLVESTVVFSDATLDIPVIGGRDYYIWIVPDRPWDSPDSLFRMRVAWPTVAGGATNDEFDDMVDLDDTLWHSATTQGATDESFPGEYPFGPGFKLEPDPRTVWFKMSYGADPDTLHVESRFASESLLYEWYGIRERDEYLRALVDTFCSIVDGGIVVDPRLHWEVSDTLVTPSDAVLLQVSRAVTDRLTTMTDVVQKGPADSLVMMSDSIVKGITKKLTDTASFTSSHFITRRVARGRTLADTIATVSDSLAILELTRFDLVDTAVTSGDSLVRQPIVFSRSLVGSGVEMSDALTRIPPVTVTDTIATVTDSLDLGIVRGRAMADRLALMSDSIRTNHPHVFDYALQAYWWGDMDDHLDRRVSRRMTDTITTISDSVS